VGVVPQQRCVLGCVHAPRQAEPPPVWSRFRHRRILSGFETAARMTDVILAVVEHPEAVPRTLAAAATLAALVGDARVNVIAIRSPPEAEIVPGEEVLTRPHAERLIERERARVAALRVEFDRFPGAEAFEWIDVEGLIEPVIEDWGGRADIIVMPLPASEDTVADRAALHAALFRSDRPVLLVPPRWHGSFGRRVAIAWRDDRRTIKALIPALRWLDKAERIEVLAGFRAGAVAPSPPAILAEHGIAASFHALPIGEGVFGAALLKAAHEQGADLLIAGAFVHNPLRTLVLGGVTRYLLAHADLPVLVRH